VEVVNDGKATKKMKDHQQEQKKAEENWREEGGEVERRTGPGMEEDPRSK